ncbi:replication-associated recombination protein A [Pueribacillus sp. YX66]|uniref:replication-associated recombination protein A n=1 Tax=Pueribacillus sp. YX66 TaxID=3229242 RepID=UPI00358D6E1F
MQNKPLAFRMRPKTIDDVIGQKHLVGEGELIWRMVKAKQLSSMIMYGPPGTGKTSIAIAIAGSTNIPYRMLNAVVNNKKDIEIVIEEAKMSGQLILILDEIHRLDKGRQDYLLPFLENGLITLIGATTSNPFHSINPAIRSRCQIFELHPLTPEEIEIAIERALRDPKNGFGHLDISITDEAMTHLASMCGGDVRAALNALEIAVLSTKQADTDAVEIDLKIAEQSIQKKSFSHDKNGDAHYDVLSAFQKSIRGSDVDAALHYLARLIEAGDLTSIARRLLVTAYEDIGLASPQASVRTLHAIEAAERVGFPEARIPLANAVIELCLSPKSNSAYKAIDAALHDIKHRRIGEIPLHLKDAHYKGAKTLGRGVDYLYPHSYENSWVDQQYLPDPLTDQTYYIPKQTGKFEQALAQINYKLKKNRNKK